jgi:hypothetical protein
VELEIIWIRSEFRSLIALCFMSHFFVMDAGWRLIVVPIDTASISYSARAARWIIHPSLDYNMLHQNASQFEDAEEDASLAQQGRPGRDATATYLDDEAIVDPSVEAEENVAAVQVQERLEQMGLAGRAARRDGDAETEVGEDGLYVPTGQGGVDDDEEGIRQSWSDYSDEEDYLYDEDGNPLDEGNIDDEDWEVAEGGESFPIHRRPLLIPRRLYQAVQPNASSSSNRPLTTNTAQRPDPRRQRRSRPRSRHAITCTKRPYKHHSLTNDKTRSSNFCS